MGKNWPQFSTHPSFEPSETRNVGWSMDQNDFLRTASASKTRNRTGLIDILVRKKRFSLPETVSIRVLRTASPSQSIPEGVRNDSRLFRQAPFWSSMGVVPPTSSYNFILFIENFRAKQHWRAFFYEYKDVSTLNSCLISLLKRVF